MNNYEIRKDGKTFARWTAPCCTPDRNALKSMKTAGYRLYIDGKLAK